MNIWIAAIAVVIIIALFLAEAWLEKRWRRREYKYRKKGCVMTQSEKICFDALVKTVGDRYDIFPQIHLPSILDHKVVGQNWYGAFRHIDEKSVDFVLCDKMTLSPILAIELDDRSHERPDRQERDREVEGILKGANMPLLRLQGNGCLEAFELVQKIDGAITPRAITMPSVAVADLRD